VYQRHSRTAHRLDSSVVEAAARSRELQPQSIVNWEAATPD
jgi:hypothetical protein